MKNENMIVAKNDQQREGRYSKNLSKIIIQKCWLFTNSNWGVQMTESNFLKFSCIWFLCCVLRSMVSKHKIERQWHSLLIMFNEHESEDKS